MKFKHRIATGRASCKRCNEVIPKGQPCLELVYECYTLCRGDIEEVAKRNGLDLELRDLDDVIYHIKKGIEGALDNRDEIIAEAIRQADYDPVIFEMLKKEGRDMGKGCQ